MTMYPTKKTEVLDYAVGLSAAEQTALYYMYAFMPASDVISYGAAEIASYVEAAVMIYETIPYSRTVPAELFLAYVLFHRVNNEWADCCRIPFYKELYPRIQGLSMTEAALEVNYWCYEKVSDGYHYTGSGIRSHRPPPRPVSGFTLWPVRGTRISGILCRGLPQPWYCGAASSDA